MLTWEPYSPYAAHAHPPADGSIIDADGPPGSIPSSIPGPLEPISVERMNELYGIQKQALDNRLEAEGRGYDSIFAS